VHAPALLAHLVRQVRRDHGRPGGTRGAVEQGMGNRTTTVADIMTTALMTVVPDESIESVDFEMKLSNVRHIPVVGPHNQLVGIVSDRDILRAAREPPTRPIADIMTREIRTVRPEDPARRALDVLLANKIGCVPVVGDDRQLVGIVTETSFLRFAREALADQLLVQH
jgi:CBS domain-containing protein